MEVFLYNSTVCRLCGEENDNGTLLYSTEENNQNISELVNAYLPIKVSDDGQLPRTVCPGCTIQLEATVEFINLIINGQKVLRALHLREREYKKTVLNSQENEAEVATEHIVHEVDMENGAYQPDHPVSLRVEGLERPKRKRGRPPKKHKTPEELAQEAAAKERELLNSNKLKRESDLTGKRTRKTPTRFKEEVQGKELEMIFIAEGMTDGEESEHEVKQEIEPAAKELGPKVPEVIGHTDSGELVVVVKGKGRGRPKGRLRQTRQKCNICEKEFVCSGRYMSHIASHGPVVYRCRQCGDTFPTRLDFTRHQEDTKHEGQTVIPCDKNKQLPVNTNKDPLSEQKDSTTENDIVDGHEGCIINNAPTTSLPDLSPQPENVTTDNAVFLPAPPTEEETEDVKPDKIKIENTSEGATNDKLESEPETKAKSKLKCPHCDKLFSTKQSKSMHIKAIHKGERPYSCAECDATFAYPRALALHALSHRTRASKGYACDLCGKVLNHPSSVTYHKEAEHTGQKYVCGKCGKTFKHRQLLQRHQLVHTQHRPFLCKMCNATFKTKANLMNHQLLHTGVKKYSCDLCKQKFAHKTSLTLHMRWHNGQKPYVCRVCGKAFSQKGNLSEHSRIHTGEKPFQCAHCPRRFTTSSQHRLHLRRHQPKDKTLLPPNRPRTHLHFIVPDGPPFTAPSHAPSEFQCQWCGRGCSSRWALIKHARRHTGEKPFKCPHCPRTFADGSNLNKHKKNMHKQVSLLANNAVHVRASPEADDSVEVDEPTEFVVETSQDTEEHVIYVTYDGEDSQSPHYHLVDEEQIHVEEELEPPAKVLSACELFAAPAESVLLQQKLEIEPVQEHMPVTDEQGNPLHFTMQDGTQLAITSLDGQSLQVITQDGQTIPVEINNGFAPEDQIEDPNTIVHHLNLDKPDGANSPVTHYYTLV